MERIKKILLPLFIVICISAGGCSYIEEKTAGNATKPQASISSESSEAHKIERIEDIPAFAGEPYVVINDNIPDFKEADGKKRSFESYSDLDQLGRCGAAYANIGTDLMPEEERGSIGQVKPSGWQTAKYDQVEGKYLYNRCHLIGYQLTGENANKKNLITGTRYMNVEGMLPFENMVADYIKETENHVLYRVTPFYQDNNLVANGVQMEALSVEDHGEGICYNVYVYNNQPGIQIDYATGESIRSDSKSVPKTKDSKNQDTNTKKNEYILNIKTLKFHLPDCSSIANLKQANKEVWTGTRKDVISKGYSPCGRCKP